VFISILPIENVARMISEVSTFMRPGTLLIHVTSIENPVAPNDINVEEVIKRGITFCHFHPHFRPESPLKITAFGQQITMGIQGTTSEKWQEWIKQQFIPFGATVHTLNPGEHDQITEISQLIHMITAFLIAIVLIAFPKSMVKKAMELGGWPF
jgi:prephenate dehydrogenase